MVFISGTCCTCARTSLLAMFQPLGQITLVNACSTASCSLIDCVPARDEVWKSVQTSPYGTSMPESAVQAMGGGHKAFPLASLPLSLSSPMSKADGATAPCVCVCQGTCKCRLMRHTQCDAHMHIHMQRSALPFILPPAGHLWAANRLLPSLKECLYIFTLKWNINRCWFLYLLQCFFISSSSFGAVVYLYWLCLQVLADFSGLWHASWHMPASGAKLRTSLQPRSRLCSLGYCQ